MITIVICLKQWRYNNCIGDKNLIRSISFFIKDEEIRLSMSFAQFIQARSPLW